MTTRRRCALVFFGIDRRLDLTGPAIVEMAFSPAQDRFEVSASGFFWTPSRVENARSSEFADLVRPRLEFLPAGNYQCAPPLATEDFPLLEELAAFGDYWNDELRSLSNLVAQLESLYRATNMALQDKPDVIMFLRPDLLYHDSFSKALDIAAASVGPLALVPHWQPHGGLNDRFAICVGKTAILAYGHRLKMARDFCRDTGLPMHSERLVNYSLSQAKVPVRHIGLRGSRVRINGRVENEDFSLYGWKPALRVIAGKIRRELTALLRQG